MPALICPERTSSVSGFQAIIAFALAPPADVPTPQETAQDEEEPLFEVDIDGDGEETFKDDDILEMIDGLGDEGSALD